MEDSDVDMENDAESSPHVPRKRNPLSANDLDNLEALRQSLKSLTVWGIPFSDLLDSFETAIDSISSVNGSSSEGAINLHEGAYVLENARAIWARRVDEVAKLGLQTRDSLETQRGKANKEHDDGDKDKEKKTRNRTLHPLTLPTDDRKGESFFAEKANRKIPADKCQAKELPQLSQECYLAEAQPRSLGLMEHEKIHAYTDDRGNKGNDWADFQINTLKLTSEGYFFLDCLHPGFYEKAYKRIVQIEMGRRRLPVQIEMPQEVHENVFDMDHDDPMGMGDDVPPADVPQQNDVPMDGLGMDNSLPEPVTVVQEKNRRGIVAGSEGRPDRPTNLPNAPFKRVMSISAKLNNRVVGNAPEAVTQTVAAFKMRTKRILQRKAQPRVSAEVDFFLNFWDIPETTKDPKIKLGKVCRRFTERLREVATVVTKPGRGRKRKAVEVTFVSNGEAADEIEAPFAEPVVPDLDFPASAEKQNGPQEADGKDDVDDDGGIGNHDGPEYAETDEPAAPEHEFFDPGPANQDEFDPWGEMRKQGLFLRPRPRDTMSQDGASVSSSQIGNVDLCEWENKLNDFLSHHEAATLSFNLEEFGKDLVVNCKNTYGNDVQAVSRVMRRSTAGDVCRSFLSILDLANKKQIQFEAEDGNETTYDALSQTQSQGANDLGVRLMGDFNGPKNGRRPKGNSTAVASIAEDPEPEDPDLTMMSSEE